MQAYNAYFFKYYHKYLVYICNHDSVSFLLLFLMPVYVRKKLVFSNKV